MSSRPQQSWYRTCSAFRVRILWVKAGKLLPVDTGGKIRSYNLLRQLSTQHELVLLSYYGGLPDPDYDSEIRACLPNAVPMHTGIPDASVWHYATRMLSRAPYAVTKFSAPRVSRAVAERLADGRFDVAVCDFLSASLNFPRTSATPTVLFQHNVESVLWRRQAAHERNAAKRLAFAIEALKMARYERAAVRRFAHVIAVSDRDREVMSTMVDASRITVVPTGVDVQQYQPAASCRATQPLVMFLGSMDWEANADAVEYFCSEIWPAIRTAVPSARFRIVGRNPGPRVRLLASDSVEVTGTVSSVIDHLKETAVFAVPLRIGGGTRLKIFEAMAAGRAVVSTSIGAEGLDVRDGRDILLADSAPAFADAVVRLLGDEERRRQMEVAAADTAARHDWPAIAEAFAAVLGRVVRPPAVERTGAAVAEPHAATR
jgi:glycosyltransferase involved in cell wall biosynthesis